METGAGTVERLVTLKADPGRTEVERIPAPAAAEAGDVVLKPDRFALTTNNITYAAFGEAMDYWEFFPTGREGVGMMPVWGFADVVESRAGGILPGERFYGYFPIAGLVTMRAGRVTPRGFYDEAAHRLRLVSAYNQYTRCAADPAWRPELEDMQALFRPLFVTSFMLADHILDNAVFGGRRIVFSSASSKTAYGTAHCLERTSFATVGLTSPRNADFVEGLGCYGTVATYDALESLDPAVPTLYVDFSGDAGLRKRVHRHFGAALAHDCYVGSAASTEFYREADLPGPRPQFFFAPHQIRKRNADWGAAEVTRRFGEAQARFLDRALDAEPPWVRVVHSSGLAGAAAVIAELAAHGGDPAVGHVVTLD